MRYFFWLVAAAVFANGVHVYLILSQKQQRKPTISEHASAYRHSLVLYVLGHVLTGSCFVLFARFYLQPAINLGWLFYISCVAVIFECTQALLPAKGRTNQAHTIVALLMWLTYIMVVIGSSCLLPVSALARIVSFGLILLLLGLLFQAARNRQRLYRYQMAMIALFWIVMFILVSNSIGIL